MRAILIALVTLCCFSSLYADRGADHHYVSVMGEFVYLRRAHSHNSRLVKAVGAPSVCKKKRGTTLINSSNLVCDMGFDPGFRLTLKAYQEDFGTFTLRYLGLFKWTGEKNVHCPNNIRLPNKISFNTQDYLQADRAKGIYDSEFYTIDLNYWFHVTPRYVDYFSVSWTAGIRYLDIDEKLKLRFTKGDSRSQFRVKTSSRAGAAQIGADIHYNPYSVLTWGISARVGIMYNRGINKTRMTDQNNTVTLRQFNVNDTNFGYMSEIFPFIEIRPIKQFQIRISYELLWFEGVVTADRQFNFGSASEDVNHNGSVIYHGLFAGMQFNF